MLELLRRPVLVQFHYIARLSNTIRIMHYDTEYRDSQSQTSPYHRVKGVIIARCGLKLHLKPDSFRDIYAPQPEFQDKIVVRIGDMQMFWRLVIIVIGDQALQDDGLHGQLPKKVEHSVINHLQISFDIARQGTESPFHPYHC